MPPRSPVAMLSRQPTALLRSGRAATFPARRRFFFSLPSFGPPPGFRSPLPPAAPQTIETRRTLPYPASQVYTLIADVDSYAAFLPFCTSSRVTRWTPSTPGPNGSGRRWPTRADLTVGWGPVTESYTSRLYCVPDRIVEAVSGRADTTIPEDILQAHGLGPRGAHAADGAGADGHHSSVGVFDSLLTRWALRPIAAPREHGSSNSNSGREDRTPATPPLAPAAEGNGWAATEVTLSIQFRFSNPAYGLAVGRVAGDMVHMMAEAFEKRAREIYGR